MPSRLPMLLRAELEVHLPERKVRVQVPPADSVSPYDLIDLFSALVTDRRPPSSVSWGMELGCRT